MDIKKILKNSSHVQILGFSFNAIVTHAVTKI